jgi:hypothetical protein
MRESVGVRKIQELSRKVDSWWEEATMEAKNEVLKVHNDKI